MGSVEMDDHPKKNSKLRYSLSADLMFEERSENVQAEISKLTKYC